jgi:hypothetical protein
MRTTVNISDVTLRELREVSKVSGLSFRATLEQSLELGLANMKDPVKPTRFRVRSHRLGLKPGFQGVSLNQLYDQLEAEASVRG